MELDIILPTSVSHALSVLEACGYEAYIVGGCVRDSLLGRTPNDWDITTNATPDEMKACFADFRVIETGIRHGTLTVIMDGIQLEITTYRNDGEYLDNRHPVQVTFSKKVEDDLARRDFTVNAMAYHPQKGLVDLFGGREDLQAKVIRCVGDAKTRFEEDGLRILRAIRFASVLNFEIAEDTANAIHTCRELLSGIAAERVREEFCKLICGSGAVRILREYIDVIAVFLPELERCVGFEQNTKYHCYDVFEHTLQAVALCDSDDLITRLGVLLHDIGKPMCYTEDEQGGHFKGHAPVGVEITREILSRLRFDNETVRRMELLVEWHDIPLSAEKKRVKRLMQKISDADILRLLEIKRCDRLAHAPDYRELPPELKLIPAVMDEIRAEDACLSLRTLAVGGDDLMALGVPKGKAVGQMLQILLDEVIEERLPNEKEALIGFAEEHIKKA
ncbi:MAG: HDIG domain-containing protein [Ruminococcaceae bacterium]|nr:HDIG domain-containing protein [Oscillospiraceae bacterium]